MPVNPEHTIHEITRNLTKQREPMLILDALMVRFEPAADFLVKA